MKTPDVGAESLSIEEIETSINKNNDRVRDIATASKEQALETFQITSGTILAIFEWNKTDFRLCLAGSQSSASPLSSSLSRSFK